MWSKCRNELSVSNEYSHKDNFTTAGSHNSFAQIPREIHTCKHDVHDHKKEANPAFQESDSEVFCF